MKLDIKWFVEIIQERSQVSRIEPCGSLREAREIAEKAEAQVDFDGTTDCIAIYRGEDWATSTLYE